MEGIDPFQSNIAINIKTSHLICTAKPVIFFCMKCNTGLECVKVKSLSFHLTLEIFAPQQESNK